MGASTKDKLLGWGFLILCALGALHNFVLVPMVERSITASMEKNKEDISSEIEKAGEGVTKSVEEVYTAIRAAAVTADTNAKAIKDNSSAINALRDTISKHAVQIQTALEAVAE